MFCIDYRSRKPLYQQIIDQVEQYASRGILLPGEQLPSVRSLAMELSINPNTVARAYSELEHRGVVFSRPAMGYFVSDNRELLEKTAERRFRSALAALTQEAIVSGISEETWLVWCKDAWEGEKHD